jgi:hypothetical protein
VSTAAIAAFSSANFGIEEPATSSQLSGIVPLTHATPQFLEAVRTISGLMHLPPNWDSYGSPRIQEATVRRAVQVLYIVEKEKMAPPSPHIVPVSGGGLQIEWRTGGRELEIELLPDGSIEFLTVEGEQINESFLRPDRIDLVVPMLIEWLSTGGGRPDAAASR